MSKKTEFLWWALALLVVALAYFSGLFIDLTGDSGLYAAISKQMVESGDWFNLKINGQPYDQKPHLFFWLAGLGISLFGNSNFAFKLFPFIYGLAGIYFTYRLGKLFYGEKSGKFAALIVATSQLFFLYFFDLHTDTVLQANVILAMWQLAAYLQNKKAIHFVFGFVGVGLAMFTKGPVGAVIPFLAVLFYLLAQKDFRQLFHPKWILGILIAFAVTSPALWHLYKSFGPEGLKFFFITNNVGRITGSYAGSSTDYLFYIHTLLWAFLPWTLIVVLTIFSEIKSWFGNGGNKAKSLFLLGSVLVLLVVLSVAKGKAPNYILLAFPAISVLAGERVRKISESQAQHKNLIKSHEILAVLMFLFFAGSGFILRFETSPVFLILVVIGAIAFVVLLSRLAQISGRFLLLTVIAAGFLNLFLNAKAIPQFYSYQGARKALEIYTEKRGPADTLVNLHLEEYQLYFWSEATVKAFPGWDNFYEFVKKEGSWVYTDKKGLEVVKELTPGIEKVYPVPQIGMNRIIPAFIFPTTRQSALKPHYLIKVR